MKRFLAGLIVCVMLVTMLIVPVSADEIEAGIFTKIEFDKDTGMVSISGVSPAEKRTSWLTYYMLNPGYDYTDILTDPENEKVVANYGQIVTDLNGKFSVPAFKYSGEAGVCKLYITTAKETFLKEVDTTATTVSEQYMLEELYALPTVFPAPESSSVKDIFFEVRDELPDEMPIVSPREPGGISVVYVDVNNGVDKSGNGSIDNPYKTIRYATDRHREAGTVICLREGTYPFSDNLEAAARIKATEELPYFITSYPGEEVIVTGGTEIDGSLFKNITDTEIMQRLDPGVIDKVLVADLSQLIPDGNYGSITTSNAPVLFVGDSKYQIARWPNSGMTTMKKCPVEIADTNDGTANKLDNVVSNGVIDAGAVTTGIGSSCGQYRQYSKRATELNRAATEANGGVETIVSKDTGIEFCVDDLTPFSWVNTGDIWMYGSFYTEWTHNHFKIAEFNAETESIRTTSGLGWGSRWNSGNKFYYYNILEELDAPGEWFLDKETGKLYIYPVGDITDEEIVYATKTDAMWRLYYMENIIVNGIKFRHSRGMAVEIQKGTNNVIQNCTFENTGSGVTVTGTYSGVINSEFKNLAGKAITLNGEQSATSMNATRQFAQNNKLHSTTGISVSSGVGNIVSHNFVSNNVGSAIGASSSKETILEYNEIVGGPRETLDSGAFYINGNNHFHRATHVRYNYIHDIGSTSPRSIYFDDMLSGCYAYGNILEGGWMQIHNGSENVVYNNVFTDHKSNSLSNQPNYYGTTETAGWPERWYATSLNMGTMSSALKSLYNANTPIDEIADGTYKDIFTRYPHLYEWSKLMLKRIYEYKGKDKTAYTGKLAGSAYLSDYKPSDEFTDGESSYYNLDRYLRASRDNYVVNNIFANTLVPKLNQYDTIAENKTNGTRDSKNGGIIRTTYENNHQLSENPFVNKNYSDTSITASYGIEAIPFDKMGITSGIQKFKNGKARPISPADTTDTTILGDDLSLQWTPVVGAQLYKVELAKDEAFNIVLQSKELRDMQCGVSAILDPDTVYYWRVTTTPQGKGSEGEVTVSDVFKFKTSAESDTGTKHNEFGITDYKMTDDEGNVYEAIPEDGKFNINAHCYNLSDDEKTAVIYIAGYTNEGKLAGLATHKVTVAGGMLSTEFDIPVEAPDAALIKMFVWSPDGKMMPYSFVKTIK